MCFIGRIKSLPNNNWRGIQHLIVFVDEKITNYAAAKMTNYGSYLLTEDYVMLQVLNRFPRTWQIHYNTTLDMGFAEVLGLAVIPYYVSIRDFMNSWPINYDPWLYFIYIGLGYLDNHIVSTNFVIDTNPLSLYCSTSNYPVTGSIIVTAFRRNFSFCPFLLMT